MNKYILLLSLLALSACGTQGTINGELLNRPAPTNKALLIIKRDNSFRSGGIAAYVSIDGQRVAELGRNATFVKDIDPGKTVLSVTTAGDPGSFTSVLVAKKGQTYHYLISPNEGKSTLAIGLFGYAGDIAGAANSNNTGYLQIAPDPAN